MDIFSILLVLLTTATGTALQGMVGLGLNLFAAPVVMMVEPRLVPGPIMAAALVLTVLIMLRDRSGLDLHGVGWMAAGMLPGTALAAWLLPLIPLKTLSILLGLLVLAGVGLSLSGLRFPPKKWVLFTAGFVSGVSGTLASIGGPPVALVNQEMEPKRLRATLSGYFTLSSIAALVGLAPVGRFGTLELGLTLWLLPGVLLGFLASFTLAKRVNKTWSRRAVLGLSALSALVLLARQL